MNNMKNVYSMETLEVVGVELVRYGISKCHIFRRKRLGLKTSAMESAFNKFVRNNGYYNRDTKKEIYDGTNTGGVRIPVAFVYS